MKEQIEKKLGCSIEEYYKRRYRMNRMCAENGGECEIPSLPKDITFEELDFIEAYLLNRL